MCAFSCYFYPGSNFLDRSKVSVPFVIQLIKYHRMLIIKINKTLNMYAVMALSSGYSED